MRQRFKPDERWLLHPWFQTVREINPDRGVRLELVSGFGEFETDLHVGDGVGGHHELEAV